MKIKEHPKVKQQWGSWTQPLARSGSGFKSSPPDIGECILKGARYSPKDGNNPAQVHLDIECQGQRVSVPYAFDDSDFADKLGKKLNASCIGKTITEIGEAEIDF